MTAVSVALRNGFRELQSELAAAEKALPDTKKRMPHRQQPASVEAEVEKAMALARLQCEPVARRCVRRRLPAPSRRPG